MRVIGHALRVIAGRHRDHAAPPLVRRQRLQPMERAALLEGRGELEVFEFEPEIAAADLAQRPALIAFGDKNRAGDGRGRGPDVVKRDGKRPGVAPCWSVGMFLKYSTFGVASLRGDRRAQFARRVFRIRTFRPRNGKVSAP